jgi:hypothetical protein
LFAPVAAAALLFANQTDSDLPVSLVILRARHIQQAVSPGGGKNRHSGELCGDSSQTVRLRPIRLAGVVHIPTLALRALARRVDSAVRGLEA